MPQPSSLYCRLTFAPQQFAAFMRSKPVRSDAYSDWNSWSKSTRFANAESLTDRIRGSDAHEFDTVEALIDNLLRHSPCLGQSAYNPRSGVWQFSAVFLREHFGAVAHVIAPLRGASAFRTESADDFLALYSFLWDPDYVQAYLIFCGDRSVSTPSILQAHMVEAKKYLCGQFDPQGEPVETIY